MARVIGRGKEDEIAGPQVIKSNRLPLPNLCFGCARQIDMKGILVNRFHEPGAIDAVTAGSAQLMAGSIPALIFFKNALLHVVGLG